MAQNHSEGNRLYSPFRKMITGNLSIQMMVTVLAAIVYAVLTYFWSAAMGGLIAPGSDAGAWSVPHVQGSLDEYAHLQLALGGKCKPPNHCCKNHGKTAPEFLYHNKTPFQTNF